MGDFDWSVYLNELIYFVDTVLSFYVCMKYQNPHWSKFSFRPPKRQFRPPKRRRFDRRHGHFGCRKGRFDRRNGRFERQNGRFDRRNARFDRRNGFPSECGLWLLGLKFVYFTNIMLFTDFQQ